MACEVMCPVRPERRARAGPAVLAFALLAAMAAAAAHAQAGQASPAQTESLLQQWERDAPERVRQGIAMLRGDEPGRKYLAARLLGIMQLPIRGATAALIETLSEPSLVILADSRGSQLRPWRHDPLAQAVEAVEREAKPLTWVGEWGLTVELCDWEVGASGDIGPEVRDRATIPPGMLRSGRRTVSAGKHTVARPGTTVEVAGYRDQPVLVWLPVLEGPTHLTVKMADDAGHVCSCVLSRGTVNDTGLLFTRPDRRMRLYGLKDVQSDGPASAAADALVKIGAPAVEPLISAMSHASAWVQYHAATALGRIGDARAAVALTDALSGTDESVRRASGDALVRIGQPSVEPLVMVLGEAARRSAARVEAARVLGEIADARAIGPLLMAVDSPDIGIKWEAMRALGHFRDRRVTQTLVAVLHAKAGKSKKERSLAPHTRRIAAEALGAAADPEAVAPLSAALKDPDLSVVIAAHTSLVLVGDPAVGPLIALLAGKDRALRTEAVEILSHIADRTGNRSALDAVLRVLAGTDAALRSSAVQALVTVKDRHALDEVVEALADKVSRVRWAALDALRSRSNAGANPLIADALIDALSHQTPLVRRAASVALQSISGKNYGEDREAWLFWKRNQP